MVTLWISIIALALAVILATLVTIMRKAMRVDRARLRALEHTVAELQSGNGHAPHRKTGPVVVIYNPLRANDLHDLREIIIQTAGDAGLGEPVWIPTTAQDAGGGQARRALDLNPSVVIAAGGDGTVRQVAGALAGTGVPLGIMPIGTGNLLARNLGIPLDSERNMASVAITGRTRRIDIGWMNAPVMSQEERAQLTASVPDAVPFEGTVPFVVISGIGFDAKVMSDTNARLKRSLGWIAYIFSGLRHLSGERLHATIITGRDGTPGADTSSYADDTGVQTEARSIMFANCGRLPGGFVVAPEARVDDGWLDIAVMNTRGGLIGWGDLVRRAGTQSVGETRGALPEAGNIKLRRTRQVTVTTSRPEQVEADGDLLGFARHVSAWVEEGALAVRVM
ncbi:diacylglycerol kinase family protein [Actinobaculum sp. 352]|uniref:diacylglycerol/lipid kinase family protein n=1 Tax=Actinobaculum sp. 352 TaxID=2490946 RepID=UPI000F7EFB38|nr:diacylglycerol kinase family protein [Actinobaculum sp. 352]RTE49182.1 hypothetical protein EKN07_06275 [Actinobaculum sp. 352]